MKTVFSTEHVHPRDRSDLWHSVARKDVVEQTSTPRCRNTFGLGLDRRHRPCLGPEIGNVGHTHTRRHIADARIDEAFICRQFVGHVALEQDGRQVVLEPGDVTLIDPRLEDQGCFSEDSDLLALKIPRQLMEARLGQTREMTARSVKPSTAETGLRSPHPHLGPLKRPLALAAGPTPSLSAQREPWRG